MEQTIGIMVSVAQVNIILLALSKLPLEQSLEAWLLVKKQAEDQLKPKPEKPEKPEKPKYVLKPQEPDEELRQTLPRRKHETA